MNRKERQRREDQTARLNALNLQLVVAGYVGTLGMVAAELEAGLLDPGTHRRVEFIAEVRRIQEKAAADMPEALTLVAEDFEKLVRPVAKDGDQ